MTVRLSTAARNASSNAVVDLIDAGPAAGQLKIYSGNQPATADDAVAGTLLATVALADPAFGDAANGAAQMADPAAVTAAATGTAGWFRITDSTGATVMDGSVSDNTGNGDLKLSTTSLQSGGSVDIAAGPYTTP